MNSIKPKLALAAACLGMVVLPSLGNAATTDYKPAPTGQRAAAVHKCKKKKGAAKKKCLKKANKKPV